MKNKIQLVPGILWQRMRFAIKKKKIDRQCYLNNKDATVAQMAEHSFTRRVVIGSNPIRRFFLSLLTSKFIVCDVCDDVHFC